MQYAPASSPMAEFPFPSLTAELSFQFPEWQGKENGGGEKKRGVRRVGESSKKHQTKSNLIKVPD